MEEIKKNIDTSKISVPSSSSIERKKSIMVDMKGYVGCPFDIPSNNSSKNSIQSIPSDSAIEPDIKITETAFTQIATANMSELTELISVDAPDFCKSKCRKKADNVTPSEVPCKKAKQQLGLQMKCVTILLNDDDEDEIRRVTIEESSAQIVHSRKKQRVASADTESTKTTTTIKTSVKAAVLENCVAYCNGSTC